MTNQIIQPPPRLILGATLLFWGAMTGQTFLALILALMIESRNWIRSRWDFTDQACARAWHLCLVLIILIAIPVWLDGNRFNFVPKLLCWTPVILFPLQFIQSFGFVNYLNLSNFYFFSHVYRKRNEELGIIYPNIRFNFGNVYFVAIIIAACFGPHAQQKAYYIGIVILTAWLLLAHVKSRFFAIISLLIFVTLFGLAGQIGMSKLYAWASNLGYHEHGSPTDLHSLRQTNIGSLGTIKQSSEMRWRLKTMPGQAPPKLLRTSTYNRYRGVMWKATYPVSFSIEEQAFRDLETIDLSLDESYDLLRENMNRAEITKKLPKFEIRGACFYGDPLPLPGNSSTLQNFIHEGVEINPLGTVRIFPQKSIIQGQIRWKDDLTIEAQPFSKEDLAIDEYEIRGIHDVAEALGLKQLTTTAEKIKRLKKFFDSEFQYTRHLTIGSFHSSKKRPTHIETFLTTNKRGHCEYFATAATLLLRAADVPARYSIGFSVMEKNHENDEWIIRGTHAHAWTRFWDNELQAWVDFDPTPSGWLDIQSVGTEKRLSFLDFYQRAKEDFFLWRNQPSNRLAATVVIWVFGSVLITYIAIRLKKSRLVIKSKKSSANSIKPTLRTPLHKLEKVATKILGPRSTGETWITWLRKLRAHQVSETDLDHACNMHQQLRFDPVPSEPNTHRQLAEITHKLINQLKIL